LTHNQLVKWGAKHHELSVGKKEHYDIWIDDKAFWSEDFFRNTGVPIVTSNKVTYSSPEEQKIRDLRS
jgi:hypothetical protein